MVTVFQWFFRHDHQVGGSSQNSRILAARLFALVTAVAIGLSVSACSSTITEPTKSSRKQKEPTGQSSPVRDDAKLLKKAPPPLCKFDHDIEVLSTYKIAVGNELLSLSDSNYLQNRCILFDAAKRLMPLVTATAGPFVLSPKVSVPSIVGVRISLPIKELFGELPGRTILTSVQMDLSTLAKEYLGVGSLRTILVASNVGTAKKDTQHRLMQIASTLQKRSFYNATIYIAGALQKKPPAIGSGASRAVASNVIEILEFRSEQALFEYAKLAERPITKFDAGRYAEKVAGSRNSHAARVPKPKRKRPMGLPALRSGAPLDLGGHEVMNSDSKMADLVGSLSEGKSLWDMLSPWKSAYASLPKEAPHKACIDQLFQGEIIRNKLVRDEAKPVRYSAFAPMLFGTTWTQFLNGHKVALTKVGILRETGKPHGPPEVIVYHNYQRLSHKQRMDQEPYIKVRGAVRGSMGKEGILYRVFLDNDAWPLRCIDLVFSRKGPRRVSFGTIYYDRNGRLMAVNFQPKK